MHNFVALQQNLIYGLERQAEEATILSPLGNAATGDTHVADSL
jgi:hypothetical protein